MEELRILNSEGNPGIIWATIIDFLLRCDGPGKPIKYIIERLEIMERLYIILVVFELQSLVLNT